MKKILLGLIMVFGVSFACAQAYTGRDDDKIQIGANFQQNGTGIVVMYDYGVGENFSFGILSSYVLGVEETIGAIFRDRIDLKVRFNANIGSVMNLPDDIDIYPGLDLSFKNFGAHLGTRYFFSDGFGLFTEASIPLARYKVGDLTYAQKLQNQFVISIGAVFNL